MMESNDGKNDQLKIESEEQGKRVEFYSQTVATWFNSSMERDKSLLTLSVAGLGVLLALMPVAVNSIAVLILYYIAAISLLLCVFSVLLIFDRNKKHIEDILKGKSGGDVWLALLDRFAAWSFNFGILFCAIIGLSSITSNYFEKEISMASNKKITQNENVDFLHCNNGVPKSESINNFNKLVPVQQEATRQKNEQSTQNNLNQQNVPSKK